MDKLTIDRIAKAHPSIREKLLQEYKECNNLLPKGVRLRFAYVYRSPEEQDKLYKQRPKVTNAKAWQSIHNYGLAFDIVILRDKDNNGTFESIDWDINSPYFKKVVTYFKNKGYEHGGDWARFKDYPHFQVKGTSWQKCYEQLAKGNYTLENGIKYPNL